MDKEIWVEYKYYSSYDSFTLKHVKRPKKVSSF